MELYEANKQTALSWDARFNRRTGKGADKPPRWANPRQREKWGQRGLVLWEQASKTVTHLTAGQALQILSWLKENAGWKRAGITLGEPVTMLWIDEPDRSPEPGRTNQIQLTPEMTRSLFEWLLDHQPALGACRQADDAARAQLLSEVYEQILNWRGA